MFNFAVLAGVASLVTAILVPAPAFAATFSDESAVASPDVEAESASGSECSRHRARNYGTWKPRKQPTIRQPSPRRYPGYPDPGVGQRRYPNPPRRR